MFLYLCKYTCIYGEIFLTSDIHVCTHMYVYVCVFAIYICICMYACIYLGCIDIYLHVFFAWVNLCVYIYVCAYIMSVSHVFFCKYDEMYIYLSIYLSIYLCAQSSSFWHTNIFIDFLPTKTWLAFGPCVRQPRS